MSDKDFFVFVGPPLSGKTKSLEYIKQITELLNKDSKNEDTNQRYKNLKIAKIFQKAYSPDMIFADYNEQFSKTQFYSNCFY